MAKRRSKGEGSIFYLDSKELWGGQITLPDGKRKLKYSKKQSTVREWLLEKRRALKDGTFVDDESVTVAQYFTHYLHDVAVHSVRPKTFERYEGLYRLHIKPQLGRIKLSKLRPDHLQGLYSYAFPDGRAPNHRGGSRF